MHDHDICSPLFKYQHHTYAQWRLQFLIKNDDSDSRKTFHQSAEFGQKMTKKFR